MIESIHELIEQTAQKLQRSVAVDDAGLRLLGSSTHFEDVDEARLSSLVGRKVMGPLRDYVMGQNAQTWRDVTVLPARPDLGLERDRLCFPLRSRFELLGFMWIMSPTPLADDELEVAREGAEHIQQALARRAQSRVDADIESESLVLALLSPDVSDRVQAARDMRDLGMFVGLQSFSAIAVTMDPDIESAYGEAPADVVRRALYSATTGRRREAYAFAASGSESTVILGYQGTPDRQGATSLARSILGEIQRLDAEIASAAIIGIGSEQSQLESIAASFDQALVAVRIGRARGQSIVSWADHPTDALLNAILAPGVDEQLIPRVLRGLSESQPESTIDLLETLLDNAGNVIATADELHLHRTTVYYRIKRFQETTGLDLNDGSTRLLLHLWLRARRFLPVP